MATELIPFAIKAGWLGKLAKKYISLRGTKVSALDSIADELFVTPQDLAPFYIEPFLQPYREFEEEFGFREPALQFLERFLKSQILDTDGRKQLFLLADAGMGKSSLLAMFKLGHHNNFWPKNYNCIPIKLGPETLGRLKKIKGRRRTVLLLDALDEDPEALGRIEDRIIDLLRETKNFLRVIITCRNQFLPLENNEIFPRQDRIKVGGFTCPVKYLSIFNDQQVDEYLNRRFLIGELIKKPLELKEKIAKAKKIIEHAQDLRFRPMLLSYIEDLVDEDIEDNPYLIYKTLINKWLEREEREKFPHIKTERLLKACFIFTWHLTKENSRELGERRLNKILQDYSALLEIKHVNFGGRSLLNRNSDGAYHFAHHTFQEFLMVYSLEKGFDAYWRYPTGMIINFLKLSGLKNLARAQLSSAILYPVQYPSSENEHLAMETPDGLEIVNLDNFHQKFTSNRVDLIGASFAGANMARANLDYSNLTNSNLARANLDGAGFNYAILNQANLKGATLISSLLIGASMILANMNGSDLTGADLTGVNFAGADLTNLVGGTKIKSIEFANIYGIQNPPKGFRQWALANGAVEMPPNEWEKYKKKLNADK